MSEVDYVSCDMCSGVLAFSELKNTPAWVEIYGDYKISCGENDYRGEVLHFCSTACLAQWVTKLANQRESNDA